MLRKNDLPLGGTEGTVHAFPKQLHQMNCLLNSANQSPITWNILVLPLISRECITYIEKVYLSPCGAEFTAIILRLQWFCFSLCRCSNELNPFPQQGFQSVPYREQHQVQVSALNICSCPSSQHLSQQGFLQSVKMV